MSTNIDEFNILTGLVIDQLYKAFPIKVDIDAGAIAEAMGVEVEYGQGFVGERTIKRLGTLSDGQPFNPRLIASLNWLSDEGFIRARGEWSDRDVQLTAKALAALDLQVAPLQRKLGDRLGDAVQSAGSEAGKAAIGEVIGQMLGAAVKSIAGS